MPDKKVPCEVYSRIIGYYRPVRQWNRGAQQAFEDRKTYDVPKEADLETSGVALQALGYD